MRYFLFYDSDYSAPLYLRKARYRGRFEADTIFGYESARFFAQDIMGYQFSYQSCSFLASFVFTAVFQSAVCKALTIHSYSIQVKHKPTSERMILAPFFSSDR